MSNTLLKHQGIIDRLSDNQKLRLLSDINTVHSKDLESVLTTVNPEFLSKFSHKNYQSPLSLARSWDTNLIEKYALCQLEKAKKNQVGIIDVPMPKPSVCHCGIYTSEDPIFSKKISQCYIKATEKLFALPIISGFEITDSEISCLDKMPDKRAVYEYLAKPYIDIINNSSKAAFSFCASTKNNEYGELNNLFMSIASNGSRNFIIAEPPLSFETVSLVSKNVICIGGSYEKLCEAFENYRHLSKGISNGKNTLYELDLEIEEGRAISTESIDRAVNNAIEFIVECGKVDEYGLTVNDNLNEKAIIETSVLLKNDDSILPLASSSKKKKRICIIGSISEEYQKAIENGSDILENINGYEIQYVKGYDINKQRESLNVAEIQKHAEKADYIVLNLSVPTEYKKSSIRGTREEIPANQIAISYALSRFASKTVAVVSSDHTVNMPFAEFFSAVLLVPECISINDYKSVFDILVGKVSPSGKLTDAVYFDFNKENARLSSFKRDGTIRTGIFIGYRYYDSDGHICGYPFGHGLSYSNFLFSRLKTNGTKIEVTVKNIGKYEGAETVQVYVQKKDSSVIRPKKELAGFGKVKLAPGKSQTLSIELELPQVYDQKLDKFLVEDGEYTVFVASSISDIKLKGSIQIKGEKLESDNKKLSDYLCSESNILSDNYTLEVNCAKMKRSKKNIIYVLLMMLSALGLGIYCGIAKINDSFFTLISLILLAGAFSLLFYDMLERSKFKKKEAEELNKVTAESFSNAVRVSVLTSENMFINEFDTPEQSEISETYSEEPATAVATEPTLEDTTATFTDLCRDLELLLNSKGSSITKDSAARLIASIASSRIVITNNTDSGSFYGITEALCQLCGTDVFYDTTESSPKSVDDLLFSTDENAIKTHKNLYTALTKASQEKDKLFIIALDNIDVADLSACFVPFIRYAQNPFMANEFYCKDEKNEKTKYKISSNVRFILNLKPLETLSFLPTDMGDVSAVVSIKLEKFDGNTENISLSEHKLSGYMMEHLVDNAKKSFIINEEAWKRIDDLETYVTSNCGYKFGNRLCISVESFCSVFSACGEDEARAIDNCISAKLLPAILPRLYNGTQNVQYGIVEEINNIFRDIELTETRRMLTDSISKLNL